MPDETAPKSAFEIAMERLKKKDADAGVAHAPVTDAQKAAIAEIRNFYESKLAEVDVLHQGVMRTLGGPEQRAAADHEYRRDRERLTTERDAKIEKARSS